MKEEEEYRERDLFVLSQLACQMTPGWCLPPPATPEPSPLRREIRERIAKGREGSELLLSFFFQRRRENTRVI